MNCAGLSREFLETELFGHEKGAFTGAVASKPGLLEVAHRGVVFLDEIGDLDPQVQPKLLKVLEEKRFRRLGEVRDRQVDIQLIAASHQNLPQLVNEKRFRSDLYFRISTIPLRVPALRERTEDIPILARGLLDSLRERPRPPRPEAVAVGRAGARRPRVAGQRPRAAQRARARGAAVRPRRARGRGPALRRTGGAGVAAAAGGPLRRDGSLTLEELERAHIERVLRGARRAGRRGLAAAGDPAEHALPEDQEIRPRPFANAVRRATGAVSVIWSGVPTP